MSLTTALNIAQTALFNTSRQTSIVSRNISDASNPDYSRRSGVLTSTAPGARVEIQRATNDVLSRQNLVAISAQSGQGAVSGGLDRLDMAVNGVDNASSPATALANLQEALQLYASTPSNNALAESAVDAARQVVGALNQGTSAIQEFRAETDQGIADAVSDLNTLLSNFGDVNNEIIKGTRAGRDVSDALDQRDALLKKISQYVPVSTVKRSDNDMMLTTTDGAVLFETVPRPMTFQPNAVYAAGMSGNAVYIDGVPMSAGSGGNTDAKGSIAGMLQMRDTVTVDMQSQLDEIARGVVTAFAETDPSGTNPDAAGLFTWSGGPNIPASGTITDGLAGSIRINSAMDSSSGGNSQLLRDGGANGAAYKHNTTDAASYSDLLRSYDANLDTPVSFDVDAGVAGDKTVSDYAAASIAWMGSMRQDASQGSESKEALATRTSKSLSDDTGVNMDEEMSLLLDLEHSYQASARLISTVDSMLQSLLQATG